LIAAHEKVLATVDDNTKIIRGHGPLGNKGELQAYHDMLVVVRDRIARLVKAGKAQEQVVEARPTKEFEEKYGGANFNAAQWIGRAYVDPEIRARESPQEEVVRSGSLPPNPALFGPSRCNITRRGAGFSHSGSRVAAYDYRQPGKSCRKCSRIPGNHHHANRHEESGQ
jgi:hypothetical protein